MSTPIKSLTETPVSRFPQKKMMNTSKIMPRMIAVDSFSPIGDSQSQASPPNNHQSSQASIQHHQRVMYGSPNLRLQQASSNPMDVHTPEKRGNPPNWERLTWAPKKTFHHRQSALVA